MDEAGFGWRHGHLPLHGLLLLYVAGPGQAATAPRPPPDSSWREILPLWRNRREPPTTALLWEKTEQGERYRSHLALYRTAAGHLLRIDCEGRGSFEYRPEGLGVFWQDGTGPEHYLQTLGVPMWLELHGVPCIHANAVAGPGGAIGLIAPSRTGKTTLTAALLERGAQAMTDDMLALYRDGQRGYRVFPGWPQLRMWPDVAAHRAPQGLEALPRVHERFEKRVVDLETNYKKQFCHRAEPLQGLYLLDRRVADHGEVTIRRLGSGEALLCLLQNSMLADAYRPLGLEKQRLAALADLLVQVPVFKVRYPSGSKELEGLAALLVAEKDSVGGAVQAHGNKEQ